MNPAADLALFYVDFPAQSATLRPVLGGPDTVGMAILDAPGTTLIGGEILATDFALRFPRATFPTVRRGDQLIVAGHTYTAREAAQPASVDGLESIVPLAS
jgi:hypothetical protein